MAKRIRQRLAHLEKVVGVETDYSPTTEAEKKSVLARLARIEAKLDKRSTPPGSTSSLGSSTD